MFSATPQESTDKICLECNREFTGIIAFCPHDNTQLFTRAQDPLIGSTMAGKYQVVSAVGHGGMGVVYKAQDTLMDRTVAIKILHAQLVSDSMSVKRFQQESKAASRLKHPHVITTYDFGISPTGQPYIVMDYLDGESLAEVIKREGNVAVERAIRILSQTCDALEHAHKQGVIHRDLKPSNIVLCNFDGQTDFVRVVDFGVAKLIGGNQEGQRLTQAGEVCGSPVYMSPEQCVGGDLDRRSDIYTMGVVIYETLTGRLPLVGKTMVDTMTKHIGEMPPRFKEVRPDLYIPERLEAVVFKALAKDPHNRHQSMDQLMVDLQLAIPRPGRSEVLRALPSPEEYELPNTQGKTRKGLVIPIVAAIVAVAGLGFALLNMNKQQAPRPAVRPAITTLTAPAPAPPGPASLQQRTTPAGSGKGAAPSSAAQTNAEMVKQVDSQAKTDSASSLATTPQKNPIKVHKPVQASLRKTANQAPHRVAAPAAKVDPFSELRNEHSWNR